MTRVVDVAFEEVGQSALEQGDPNRENTSYIFFFVVMNHEPAESNMCSKFLGKEKCIKMADGKSGLEVPKYLNRSLYVIGPQVLFAAGDSSRFHGLV